MPKPVRPGLRVEVVEHGAFEGRAFARYFVYDDHGHELRQTHRDVTAEVREAERRHESLATVLARREAQ